MNSVILIVGDITEGFRFIGPFTSAQEAVEFAKGSDLEYHVAFIMDPGLTSQSAI